MAACLVTKREFEGLRDGISGSINKHEATYEGKTNNSIDLESAWQGESDATHEIATITTQPMIRTSNLERAKRLPPRQGRARGIVISADLRRAMPDA